MSIAELARRAVLRAKHVATSVPVGRRALLPTYDYAFTPAQLWELCEVAAAAAASGGAIVEVGVARGATTIFLNRHLESVGLRPAYICVDTFSGFTDGDIAVERGRGKQDDYTTWFRNQSETLFRRTIELNGLDDRVQVVRADAVTFDYAQLPDLAFALVDVDLLLPMRAALDGCWGRLVPGGALVADDCQPYTHTWDGARQAYEEFCAEQGLPVEVRQEKLGLARRPA